MPLALQAQPVTLQPASLRKVGIVVRVSTDGQAANPEGSLKTQIQRNRQHIVYRRDVCGEDWQELSVYELRAISGKHSMRRPELEPLFADIRAGRVNTVLCTALDRICRNVRDFLWFLELLNEHQAEFVCLKQNYDTTTPQGKLFITIMMALAEFEREQTAERTRDATQARSERGLWNGGRILGYDPDPSNRSSLLVNDREAAVIQAAFGLYLRAGSLKHTAEALNQRGLRTKSYTSRRAKVHPGKTFSLTAVQQLLKNRAYIAEKEIGKRKGSRGQGPQVVPAVWPAIVDKETFDEVQRLMAANGQRRHNSAETLRHVHVLGGLLHCGLCRTPMQGRSGTGRLGVRYYYYVCPNTLCGLRVAADEIESVVLDHIGTLAQTEGLLERIVTETNARLQKQKPALVRQQKALQRSLAEVNAQAGNLLSEWSTVAADQGRSFITEKLNELAQRRADLERGLLELDQQLAQVQDKTVTAEVVREALAQVHQVYACMKAYEQRELMRLVLHRAEVNVKELILEINGGICPELAPATVDLGDLVRRTQNWLPGAVPQSVLRQAFPTRLRSLLAWSRHKTALVSDLASSWQSLLDRNIVSTRAALARLKGVSRARVTQVLSSTVARGTMPC